MWHCSWFWHWVRHTFGVFDVVKKKAERFLGLQSCRTYSGKAVVGEVKRGFCCALSPFTQTCGWGRRGFSDNDKKTNGFLGKVLIERELSHSLTPPKPNQLLIQKYWKYNDATNDGWVGACTSVSCGATGMGHTFPSTLCHHLLSSCSSHERRLSADRILRDLKATLLFVRHHSLNFFPWLLWVTGLSQKGSERGCDRQIPAAGLALKWSGLLDRERERIELCVSRVVSVWFLGTERHLKNI